MKIAVIGAGVSGLAASKILKHHHDVTVLERNETIGGIARTQKINGTTYHKTGGHCFNSKSQEVIDFVFSIYPKEKWNKIERIAKIYFKNNFISYPIEFSLKEIFKFDRELVFDILEDLFKCEGSEPENLEDWFVEKFGETLAKEYFIPYNRKIWNKEPSDMSSIWVYDKLPVPNKKDIINSLLEDSKDNMPHAHFYYPKSNDQMDFINALAEGSDIKFNFKVNEIEFLNGLWIINGVEKYDSIISTIPLNILPILIKNVPENIVLASEKLNFNKVTTVLWEAKYTENTWTYFPSEDTIFHRHVHIGNFLRPVTNHIITEAIGDVPEEIMVAEGKKFSHLIKPLSYHVSDHAYVVYDENYVEAKRVILEYLDKINLHTLGRFGEWEYYNMDLCIESAIKLARLKFGQ